MTTTMKPVAGNAGVAAGAAQRVETAIEHLLFAARWLLAPVYVGLIAALALLCAKFFLELIHTVPQLVSMRPSDLIVVLLSLVDLSLAANLILMVMLAGYDNFVARFPAGAFRPAWLGQVDFGSLKLKLISSIVAIASISMLETFIDLHDTPKDEALVQLAILLGFVVTAVLLALMDRLTGAAHRPE